jgi:hypothetical protein
MGFNSNTSQKKSFAVQNSKMNRNVQRIQKRVCSDKVGDKLTSGTLHVLKWVVRPFKAGFQTSWWALV